MLCESMKSGMFIGFDRDAENLSQARVYLEEISPQIEKKYVPKNFSSLRDELCSLGIEHIDAILYDL